MDLITCINMKLFKALSGGQLWLNHYGHALFALPNQAKTTITRPSNLIYNDDTDGESGGEFDGGGNDDSDNNYVKEVTRGQRGGRRAPESPSAGTSFTTAPSSGPWVPLCFRRFLTVLISYQFRTRRSYATSRTWLTWSTMHMSSITGLTCHLIGGLVALGALLIAAL